VAITHIHQYKDKEHTSPVRFLYAAIRRIHLATSTSIKPIVSLGDFCEQILENQTKASTKYENHARNLRIIAQRNQSPNKIDMFF
jgi:hypothetical protein